MGLRARTLRGLSRARDMIGVCTMPRSYALYQEMRWLPGRLLERVNKKKSTKKRTSAVEFRYADVEVDAPVEFEGGNASVVQSNLEASDLVGADWTPIWTSGTRHLTCRRTF